MDQRFLAETASRRLPLFKAMLGFNRSCTPAPACPHALVGLGDAGLRLWDDASVRRVLSPPPPVEGFWDFSEEQRRLALLDAGTLRRSSLFFSAAVHGTEIARTIEAAAVRELRSSVGGDIVAYALKRGRYQVGTLADALRPEADGSSLPQRISRLADQLIPILSMDWPEGLRVRAISLGILPEMPDASVPAPGRDQRKALWFTMKKIILREVAPQWAPCFD